MKHREAGIDKMISVPWYPADWLSDTAISSADIATEGAWCRTLNHMLKDRTWYISKTISQWSALFRCTKTRGMLIILKIKSAGIAEVNQDRNGNITLICRRLQRAAEQREATRERVAKWREEQKSNIPVTGADCNTPVTTENGLPSSSSSFSSSLSLSQEKDLFAQAYKAAFDARFPAPYDWTKGDFPQWFTWRKKFPGVTLEEFAKTAEALWDLGQFTPKASLTIRGLCAGWAKYLATLQLQKEGRKDEKRNGPRRHDGSWQPSKVGTTYDLDAVEGEHAAEISGSPKGVQDGGASGIPQERSG